MKRPRSVGDRVPGDRVASSQSYQYKPTSSSRLRHARAARRSGFFLSAANEPSPPSAGSPRHGPRLSAFLVFSWKNAEGALLHRHSSRKDDRFILGRVAQNVQTKKTNFFAAWCGKD
jgi:hypothetical protein